MKTKIDIKSIFSKGTKVIKDDFCINLITGYQGSGKSYFATYKAYNDYKGRVIKTNMHSLRGVGKEIIYFTSLSSLYNDIDDDCVYIIDELSKIYTKDSKIDKPFYSWLQQSRKHKRHVYLITQEYLQVPQWLRGIANTIYITSPIRFTNLYCTSLGYPVLDKDTLEWGCDVYSRVIYKRTRFISSLYDTFESINTL